jgi:hypothetical protein
MKKVPLFFLFFATALYAQQDAVQKYRNFTPQEIQSLSEKTISSEVPMMFTSAAKSGLTSNSELLFGMQLNRLMYPGVHDYNAAIKSYQIDLGDTPTGVLTVWQIHNLQQRSDLQGLREVFFPDQFSSIKTDAYASVQGTMIIIDDKIYGPINHAKLHCSKTQKNCELNEIHLVVPDDKSWGQNYQIIEDSPETYDITRWDQDTIDAESPGKSADSCRTTSINLNFKTKEFYFITRNAGGNCELLGMKFDKLPKPRISQIIDGSSLINEEFSKVDKAAYDALSSEFRKKVENAISATDKK